MASGLKERAVRQQELLAEQLQTAPNRRSWWSRPRVFWRSAPASASMVPFDRCARSHRSTSQPLSGVATAVIKGKIGDEDLQRSAGYSSAEARVPGRDVLDMDAHLLHRDRRDLFPQNLSQAVSSRLPDRVGDRQ